jgi:hypothetical protein
MKKYILPLFIIGCILVGCKRTGQTKFDRSSELLNLLLDEHISLKDNKSIVLFIAGSGCSSCIESTKKVMSYFEKTTAKSNIQKCFIINEDIDYAHTETKNIRIIKRSGYELQKAGLSYPADFVFLINKNYKIEKCFIISSGTVDKILIEIAKFNL